MFWGTPLVKTILMTSALTRLPSPKYVTGSVTNPRLIQIAGTEFDFSTNTVEVVFAVVINEAPGLN